MGEIFGLLSFGPDGWGDEIAAGTWLTIQLALATLPFGLVFGFLVALARNGENRWLRGFGDAYTTVFRGLPELLTLFIVYYGGQIALQRFINLFSDTYVEVSGFVAGMIALGLVFSAFASDVFLGALRTIPKGQAEAGQALGLNRLQTIALIVAPQLLRYALPGLSNLWLVLLKDTSLVSIIALDDLLRQTNVAVSSTKEPFFFYLTACLIYLALSIISSVALQAIEARSFRGEERIGSKAEAV